MGFLSVLGKIGKGIGKVGASLIPGGSLAMDAISSASEMMGGGAQASAGGRRDDALINAQLAGVNNRGMLDAAQFNAGQQGNLIKRALAARMLQDRQAPTDPRIAKFYGGPSNELKALAAKYGGMADADVMSGGYKLTPQMAQLQKAGLLEKIGGGVGIAGGILGALGKIGGAERDDVDADQVGGGRGGTTAAPNLPYQPLPRATPYLNARRNVPMTGRLV